jgi:hypothetical protein
LGDFKEKFKTEFSKFNERFPDKKEYNGWTLFFTFVMLALIILVVVGYGIFTGKL